MTQQNIQKQNKIEKENVGGLAWLLSNKYLFVIHAFIYFAVNGLLILIWVLTTDFLSVPWPFYSILGWGIGFGFHAVTYLMYNNKVKSLSIARRKGKFAILYIYHAWFYVSVNILIIFANITIIEYLLFLWPLSMWGIGFAVHTIGFFTWDQRLIQEKKFFHPYFPKILEKNLEYIAGLKIIQFWLLVANAGYFIVSVILAYTAPLFGVYYMISIQNGVIIDPIYNILPWAIFLGIHGCSYYLFNYKLTIPLLNSSLILNLLAYIAYNVYFLILQVLNPLEFFSTQIWIHYPLILWGIIIVIHYILIRRKDIELKKAIEKMRNVIKEQLDEFQLKKKGMILLFFQWTFIAHLCVYLGGIILISMDLARLGIINVIIHVIMGWLIALVIHGGFFIIYRNQILSFLSATAILHSSIYITVSTYMVLINIIYSPGVPWSAIAIAGWGIGFGLHVLLAYMVSHR
ncbi:MAG: 2TM domain-containing protein [Promethearchaeota archaeon]